MMHKLVLYSAISEDHFLRFQVDVLCTNRVLQQLDRKVLMHSWYYPDVILLRALSQVCQTKSVYM